MNCLLTMLMVVTDEENPPAKIITAYFPNIEKEWMALIAKISKKTRRKTIKLSHCDFGLLYAATDLYGRLIASSYRHILPILKKRTVLPFPETDTIWHEDEFISQVTVIVDHDLKLFNEEFSHFPVIKAYRAIAGEMVWFDD